MRKKIIPCILFLVLCSAGFSQIDSEGSLRFDFNDHQFKELNNKVTIKPVGVTLTEDRFGNKESAVYVHGTGTSYINLGTSDLLKPKIGSISLWVNMQSIVLAGKGYKGNPFLLARNGPDEDFNIAYGFGCSMGARRIGIQATRDSVHEVMIFAKDTVALNAWYHMVMTYDSNYFKFYLNGELEGQMIKGFQSNFLEGDSVILGRSMGSKNERFSHAIFDDIRFYNRVISDEEVKSLYTEPNPNTFKNKLNEVFRYGIIILILIGIIILLLFQNRRNLKRQKEYYELHTKIKELEAKVIRAQMNPHFISNSMAAIQNLIYIKEFEKASQYLAKLSFLMRQVLNYYDKNYISLEEELQFMKLDLELEQLRFDNNFSFNIRIGEGIDTQQVIIPSLITQPFIENAVWHGLLPLKERTPHLEIRVYTENKTTFISIEDNGIGRPAPGIIKGNDSRGIKLMFDKIESVNELRNSNDFKLEIVDLFDEKHASAGTKIIIQLLNYTQEE